MGGLRPLFSTSTRTVWILGESEARTAERSGYLAVVKETRLGNGYPEEMKRVLCWGLVIPPFKNVFTFKPRGIRQRLNATVTNSTGTEANISWEKWDLEISNVKRTRDR
jgi:hypothetical protein